MIHLILCGGSGTRLWPLSRQSQPKQFHPFLEGRSLFDLTVERNQGLSMEGIRLAINEAHLGLACQSLVQAGVPDGRIGGILEPVGRNTAPAIALVCLGLPAETLVLVTPSDHIIAKQNAYQDAILRAQELARDNKIVTFGITPTRPETGYGYVEYRGEQVLSFREKPDAATAKKWFQDGGYLWNSGMFCFKAGVFLEELSKHAPDVLETCRLALAKSAVLDGFARISPKAMEAIRSVSVDYAVMEKSDRIAIVPCDIGWNDLGSFEALYDVTEPDAHGNVNLETQPPVCLNAKNNLVVSTAGRQVVLIDVEDLMVVDTGDALLLAKRGSGQKVREAVDQLRKKNPGLL